MAVSSMERFAACPFRFFLDQGLKVRERQEFELDIREQGRFQHEILLHFHRAVRSRGKRWRDLSKADALKLMDEIASEQIERFGGGLFQANEQSRFIGENYKASLQRFITAVIDWFQANSFDPEQVELPFGYEGELPGWRVPLENGNALILCGRIDRVDVYRESPGRALCVIMDYKSGMKKPDRSLMEHGIEQQLPGYLLALTQIAEVKKLFEVDELIAAGCFLIPLRSSFETTANRHEALDADSADPAFKHFGFFDQGYLSTLDRDHQNGKSGQFHYVINKDGSPSKQGFHAVPSDGFSSILAHTEDLLRAFGKRIYEGDISIRPFKKGTKTACDQCHHQPICRFDPWTQQFNSIRSA
jgi:ATP-dependent helicase/nuclease subunit B